MKHRTTTVMLSSIDRELIKFALNYLEHEFSTQPNTKANCERLRELLTDADIDIHKAPELTR